MIAAIPTSQRPEMCQKVANQLTMYQNVFVFVNNCDFQDYFNLNWNENIILIDATQIKGTGAESHNKTCQKMIRILPVEDTLFIEDDVTLSDSFKENFILTFETLKDRYKNFSLSPIYIPEKKCHYTPQQPTTYMSLGEVKIQNQRYIDGNFAIPKDVLLHFKQLRGNYPVKKANSGISPVLSRLMYYKRWPMYVTIPSMLGHGEHESLQFPEGRKRVPLIAIYK